MDSFNPLVFDYNYIKKQNRSLSYIWRIETVNTMDKISKEIQEQAMKVAKGTQRQNQTKEQTKLISQGIEKGIAEYKKQQNKKSRERDKQRKAKLKVTVDQTGTSEVIKPKSNKLPWVLLALSWAGFFILLNQ